MAQRKSEKKVKRQGAKPGVRSKVTAKPHDTINHPSHYNSHPAGIECVAVNEHFPANIANVYKYLWRAGLKDGQPTEKDYNKACWYLLREMQRKGIPLTVEQAHIEKTREQ